MMRHIFKMVWNRKRSNALLVVEIFFAFLVLFVVVALGIYSLDAARRPIGFEVAPLWRIAIQRSAGGPTTSDASTMQTLVRVMDGVRRAEGVEGVAAAAISPYTGSSMTSSYESGATRFFYQRNEVTDDFVRVMGMRMVAGRPFSKEDDGAEAQPMLISRTMARMMFGEADPIGNTVQTGRTSRARVVGEFEEFRKGGELSAPGPVALFRSRLDQVNPEASSLSRLLVRVRPGTPRLFEESLVHLLQREAPDWSFEVAPLPEVRAKYLRLKLMPLAGAALVCGFLLLMVALGLTGVVWQSVTRRTREIGLRRAQGATGRDVLLLILGELAVLTALGVSLGVLVVAQIPLLQLFQELRPPLFAASLALSIVLIFALTTLCGVAPGRLASRVSPVAALRYE